MEECTIPTVPANWFNVHSIAVIANKADTDCSTPPVEGTFY